MNTTTVRISRYAGAGLAGIAAVGILAGPASALRPDPAPGSTQPAGQDPGTSAPTSRHLASGADGIDWSVLAAGFGGGAVLTGFVVLGASQLQRRQARPA